MTNEYELKFLNIDCDRMRALLMRHGYKQKKPQTLMRRAVFHLAEEHREHHTKWARVRDEGDKITASVKWYDNSQNITISTVHEREIVVSQWQDGVAWVTAQEFKSSAYQETMRECWQHPDRHTVEISIDHWPGLNPFVEIEATTAEAVKCIAMELGFNPSQGIAGGAGIVYMLETGLPESVFNRLPRITFDCPPNFEQLKANAA